MVIKLIVTLKRLLNPTTAVHYNSPRKSVESFVEVAEDFVVLIVSHHQLYD